MAEQISKSTSPPESVKKPLKPTARSKAEILRKQLSRRYGATIEQLQKQLGWQPLTIRAAISRLRSSGFSIELDRSGKVTRYRLTSEADQ